MHQPVLIADELETDADTIADMLLDILRQLRDSGVDETSIQNAIAIAHCHHDFETCDGHTAPPWLH